MSEPTVAELDQAVDYLTLALKVSETNERAAQAAMALERQEIMWLRARLARVRAVIEACDPELARVIFGADRDR
jgi:hypothetical protein